MTRLTPRGLVAVLGLGVLLAVSGCPAPVPTPEDAGGGAGGGSACEQGAVGCACANNACPTSGECVDGACVACQRGSASCVCRTNNTCDMGLRCASGKCETCPAGQNGCACNGSMCSAGLTCSNGVCVPDTCVAGTPGCPCNAGSPVCNANAYCDMTGRCQTCSPDVRGCACNSQSMCLGGLVCNMGTMQCRDAITCAQLRGADGGVGSCAANQLCTQTPGQDAVCVAGMCEPNFKFDTSTNTCVACVSTNCANEPTCDVDGGIGGTCDAQNRVCVQAGQVATCGMCKPGFSQDAAGMCRPVPRCGSTTCQLTEFCDTSTGVPRCTTLPCPAGQAKDNANAACTMCTSPATCSGAGYSGRYWPFRTIANQRCICETLDGYFEPGTSSSAATLCDADNDGWVNALADGTDITQDPALKANARCTIRRADRVKLVDETGLAAEVHSCTSSMNLHVPRERIADGGLAPLRDGGFLPLPAAGASACPINEVLPIRLLESPRNDTPGQPMGVRVPQFGDGGRVLEARELNSLTKACVSLAADFNDNNLDDLTEIQPLGVPANDQERLRSFAYFIELYTAHFEPGANDLGALVIQERSRCDSRFPLRYDSAAVALADGGFSDGYSTLIDGGARYWRSCERRRDPGYSEGIRAPGFDFGQWSCPNQPVGTCAFEQFPSASQVGPTDPATTFFRDFSRCSLNGQQPFDRRWRGFGHHSQFKCVNVTTSNLGGVNVAPGAFDAGIIDALVFNDCRAVPCTTGDASCRTLPGAGAQTASPILRCVARTDPPSSSVGFAAVGYRPYGDAAQGYTRPAYAGGCVTEDAESSITGSYGSYVCPFPEFSREKFRSDQAFGRHSCYLRPANFLWSGPTPQRATLRWSGDGGMSQVNGVFR